MGRILECCLSVVSWSHVAVYGILSRAHSPSFRSGSSSQFGRIIPAPTPVPDGTVISTSYPGTALAAKRAGRPERGIGVAAGCSVLGKVVHLGCFVVDGPGWAVGACVGGDPPDPAAAAGVVAF